MRRHRLDSSVIAAIRYNERTRVLEVTFRSGRVYDYFDVPHSAVDELLNADSAGKYFNEQIKPHYRAKSVRGMAVSTVADELRRR